MNHDLVLQVENLTKSYSRGLGGRHRSTILQGVSFNIRRGETLGLVGESGSGKSTTAACIAGLTAADSGRILVHGKDITTLKTAQWRQVRPRMQMVFQDPFGSLDPRFTVRALVEEPLIVHGVRDAQERRLRVDSMLDRVGVTIAQAERRPHAFSGGQRQRIAIARALVLNPDLVILDEPVSALDVSVQAQVLNLLSELQDELGLTYLFIVHDLAVGELMSHRIAVMNKGSIVESGDAGELIRNPQHPYTQALIAATPGPERLRRAANEKGA